MPSGGQGMLFPPAGMAPPMFPLAGHSYAPPNLLTHPDPANLNSQPRKPGQPPRKRNKQTIEAAGQPQRKKQGAFFLALITIGH